MPSELTRSEHSPSLPACQSALIFKARAARRRAVAASGRRLAEIEAERDAAARAATAARAEAADMRARLWRESSVAVVRARAMAQAARLRHGGSEEGPDTERAASERGATTPRSPAAESSSEEGVFEATESVDDSPNHDSPCTPEGAAAKRLCFAHQRPVTALGLVNKSTGGDDSGASATATMAPSKASRGHRCVEPSSAVAAEPPAPPPSELASPDAAATAAAARTATTSVVANLAAVQLLRVSMETVSSSGVSPEDEQPLLDDSKLDDLVVSSEDIAALRKLAADASERIRQGGVEAGASAPRASTGVQGNVLLDFAADAALAAASCAVAAESAEEESSSSAASSPAMPAVGWSVLNSGAYISHLHLPTQHPLPAVAASFGGDEVTDGCGDDDGALYTRNEPQSYLRAIVRATELRAAVRPPRRATGIGRGTPTLAATDTPDLADEGARRTAAATPLTADLTNTAPVAAASRSVDSDGWGDLFSQKRHAEGSLDLVHSAAEYHNRQQRA